MIIIHNTKLYTYEETAQILAVPVQTVYNYTKAKQLKVTALHGKRYVSEAAIINYLNGYVEKAAAVQNVPGRILYGFAALTHTWKTSRDKLEMFCAEEWRKKGIYDYMLDNYINYETPITLRIYELDSDNRKLLYAYVEKETAALSDFNLI